MKINWINWLTTYNNKTIEKKNIRIVMDETLQQWKIDNNEQNIIVNTMHEYNK